MQGYAGILWCAHELRCHLGSHVILERFHQPVVFLVGVLSKRTLPQHRKSGIRRAAGLGCARLCSWLTPSNHGMNLIEFEFEVHRPTSINYWAKYQVLGSMAPRRLRCWWHHGDWRRHFWQCRWLGTPLDLGSPKTAFFPILKQLPLQIRSDWAQNYESNKCCGSKFHLRRSTVDSWHQWLMTH